MLHEYLDTHELRSELKPFELFPTASDREAWRGIDADFRAEIERAAEAVRGAPYPLLPATAFLAFVRTGDRSAYEGPHFERRWRLIAAALGECARHDGRYLDDAIDGVWAICEESFWGVSAHNGSDHPGMRPHAERPLPDIENPYIDLFAAQTAATLSLAGRLLSDEFDAVSPLILRRVEREVRRRVIDPFLHRDDFWWMGVTRRDLNNWTPWILSNVLICLFIHESDRWRLAEGVARAMRMLDRYLTVIPPDGGLDEGVAYWNMAGGALLDCLELLHRATDGAADFYREPLIRNIARYPLNAHIAGDVYVNFADCDAKPALDGERVYRFGQRIGDPELMALGYEIDRRDRRLMPRDTPEFSRILNRLFGGIEPRDAEPTPRDVTLPDLELWIRRRGPYAVAFKGGHNGESHNHNDVGSFILYKGGRPAVIDLGNMTYTARTFGPGRYEQLNTRSGSHNLPIVAGFEQEAGRERAARDVRFGQDSASMEIAGAYPERAGVVSLRRTVELGDGALSVTDAVELLEPGEVSWVFMLRERTDAPFAFDPSLRVELTELPVADPRMARSFPGSVWRMTLTAAPCIRHEHTFLFR